MNINLLSYKTSLLILALGCAGMVTTSCDDDEKPKTVPTVTTGAVSNVTETSATVAGEIVDDGNADAIIASGLAYSSTNATPTVEDNTTDEGVSEGAFTSVLKDLASGTNYHVRTYAINSIGIGYGEIVEFTTGNSVPVATNILITGDLETGKELAGSYVYADSENDAEGGTAIQWYVADDDKGTGEIAIDGATELTYTPLEGQQGKYIRVGITPMAVTGNTTGEEAKSAWYGAIGEATTITFMYNGQEVTYEIITTATGKKWMDRNLGASQVATSYQDHLAYGDVFQWGRGADGHQLLNYSGPFSVTTVNGTTTTRSETDIPVDALFIATGLAVDWRIPSNENLWQAPNYINNPCPTGWHVPTQAEWDAEIAAGVDQLKLTAPGRRRSNEGDFFGGAGTYVSSGPGGTGYYWSSTPSSTPGMSFYYSIKITSTNTVEAVFQFKTATGRANGLSCRCVKN